MRAWRGQRVTRYCSLLSAWGLQTAPSTVGNEQGTETMAQWMKRYQVASTVASFLPHYILDLSISLLYRLASSPQNAIDNNIAHLSPVYTFDDESNDKAALASSDLVASSSCKTLYWQPRLSATRQRGSRPASPLPRHPMSHHSNECLE
ncbi:hypothetical protein CC85DRAFT_41102 [Cutaneotrichosporon oleaginosum]|uniref:Uncharacterized protein n=1 Tax=Cutaneotrichosporon oleaginosum TaxID=879819 RepID=A0A0J0XS59_9TREE|nr:uncharacterized protein CC85DRAFT_41102 [Cutaneotrichosporon oleaginosum]KLT43906.1 hypothetical protein CC85DRAFT_41102 [Cutaneotrichosporon oleaginosum]TXT06355.1 hypothetical protein COLE_05686 [Cutaneotrichosporon oleaginosum]